MRALKLVVLALALLLLMALGTLYGLLRGSLPQLDGELQAAGLKEAVRITRDALGEPTLDAADRVDLAYATGFVHGVDRFFQMDLSRRLAAGELAELFGPVAVGQDRATRLFRFRSVAREVLAAATPAQRALLEAYARGVNAGLASLRVRPWEYLLLRAAPAPWRSEDSVLVVHAMWWDLQSDALRREMLRRQIDARLGGPRCAEGWKCALAFLFPPGTSWDAPAGERAMAMAEVPAPAAAALDVRGSEPAAPPPPEARPAVIGSNNWAVAGRLTATGAALIANDMHLGERVPPVWYRARLRIGARAAERGLDLNGVTLPGAPLLVAGSNGHIAWGFTNSYGNWFDVEAAPCEASNVVHEEIRVRGAPSVDLEIRSGPLGVLWRAEPGMQQCWFVAWLAQLPEATNLNLLELEHASSVAEALELAPRMGIPHQNAVLGDRDGHIAWTIFGLIPEQTSAGRARGSGPWTTAADHPRIVDPPAGRLWSANARVATDPRQLALIGGNLAGLGAEYALGARAGQIRDDLMALATPATPADMLRIQLDDRAMFLSRWQALLLHLLDEQALRGEPRRAELRQLLENWKPQASVDSVGYRLVRAYRDRTRQVVWAMLLAALHTPPEEESGPPAQFEGPLWEMVTTQPLHLLSHEYRDWRQFLLAQVDATLAELAPLCPQLARCTWGARNVVRIRHPLSGALAWLAPLIDMRALELPGDFHMPRVQVDAIGQSERFAVSPGHEDEGYLHIPGGQSAHPLSPYYRAGFDAWAAGKPLPFLPGAPRHSLTLTPGP
ncbi:MAG TPA: penicillin acylase family protein [Steroidobacteraceae bacterium]|nr:penicillin acylase family protein [Steroidobacteraceae bacterium]